MQQWKWIVFRRVPWAFALGRGAPLVPRGQKISATQKVSGTIFFLSRGGYDGSAVTFRLTLLYHQFDL